MKSMQLTDDIDLFGVLYISYLYVAEELRGLGCGRKVLQQTIDNLYQICGRRYLLLIVETSTVVWVDAQKFWTNLGFTQCAEDLDGGLNPVNTRCFVKIVTAGNNVFIN